MAAAFRPTIEVRDTGGMADVDTAVAIHQARVVGAVTRRAQRRIAVVNTVDKGIGMD